MPSTTVTPRCSACPCRYLRLSPALTRLQTGFLSALEAIKLWAMLRLYEINPFLSTDEPETIAERKHLMSCTAR